MAHITGGGITRNLTRQFPKGLGANVYKDQLPTQKIFSDIQKAGDISDKEMRQTFNMGVGFALVCNTMHANEIVTLLSGEQDDTDKYEINGAKTIF